MRERAEYLSRGQQPRQMVLKRREIWRERNRTWPGVICCPAANFYGSVMMPSAREIISVFGHFGERAIMKRPRER